MLSTASHGSHDKGHQKPSTSAKTSFHKTLFPDSTYMIDDGGADDSIGLTAGGDIIALNEFTVIPGNATITSVSIAFGTPLFPDPSLNGLSYTAVIWSDPNGDGDPSDAAVLATAPGTVSQAGTDTFLTTNFNTTITTANFFVGYVITQNAGQFPAGDDETAPVFLNRSYLAGSLTQGGGNINNLTQNDIPVATIESLGLPPGNWLIRADAGNGSPTPTPTPTATPTPTGTPGNALWYNGDADSVNGLANEDSDAILGQGEFAHVYDDFDVTDPNGWDVGSVFSNNQIDDPNFTAATWEIRQGITPGNGGTLIASGMTATPIVTATGRNIFGRNEYTVEVNGISVHLPPTSQTGLYWLNVTPVGSSGRSFVSTTSGANCVGTPCGNDQNAFFDSNFFGFTFAPTSDPNLGQPYDFSMGVNAAGGGGGGLSLVSSASRLAQGVGSFDVPLPGVEGRYAPSRDLIVFTFNEDVSGASGATTSCGTVQNVTVDPSNSKSLLVKITALSCDQQTVTVTVNGVTATNGDTLASASTSVSFLFGDVNGDGSVNNQDIQGIRAAMGQKANSSNFRADLNGDGAINNKDVGVFKTFRGDHL